MRFDGLDGVHKTKNNRIVSSVGLSAGIFLAVLIGFVYLVSFTSRSTTDEQKRALQSAIDRCVLQCYVTEGRYPESFEYIQSKYGIIYDDDLFRVDYTIYGSNMKPEVYIIQLEDK